MEAEQEGPHGWRAGLHTDVSHVKQVLKGWWFWCSLAVRVDDLNWLPGSLSLLAAFVDCSLHLDDDVLHVCMRWCLITTTYYWRLLVESFLLQHTDP